MRFDAALLAVLLLTSATIAGDKNPKTAAVEPPRNAQGAYEYQAVVEVPGVAADELHSRARAWLANTYRSASAVVQLDDASAHRLIAKGIYESNIMGGPAYIHHTVTIETKDGRYRYRFSDLSVEYQASAHLPERPLEEEAPKAGRSKMVTRVALGFDAMVASLKSAMQSVSPIGDAKW